MRLTKRHIGLASLFAAYGCFAQAGNLANLHAAYQDEPFEWCSQGTPVSILLTMDGPDVVFGQSENRSIKVRRGSSFVRQSITPRDEMKTDGPTGRFEGKFELCGSLWESYSVRGDWFVRAEDGEVLASRKVDDDGLWVSVNGSPYGLPLFRSGYLEFEEQRISVVEPLEIKRTLSIGDKP